MRQRWTKEQKAEFWAAFTAHRDEGCNIREAWSRARMDFQAEGKAAPGLNTFATWYRRAMRPQEDAEASGAEDQETAADPEETAEETAPDPDYTRRLELMCRLYRSRSEYNIDSLCDYLLPDLCAEEE